MQDIAGLKELETTTNLRILVSKLPFRLRDRWRANVCNMQDKNEHRATFRDLVEFIERQARAMLDPVFGDIHNPAETKVVPKLQRTAKPSGRPSFATTVAPVSAPNAPKGNNSQSGHTQNSSVKMSCLFCFTCLKIVKRLRPSQMERK